MTAWRITKARCREQAFDGEGARRFGGRWNTAGTRMIYTAQSRSLAILELLAHLGDPRTLSENYVLIDVTFATSMATWTDTADLPADWHRSPPPPAVPLFGDRWARQRRSVALLVPSAVCPGEHNWLLNPDHPQFAQVVRGKPQGLDLDPRLLR
ncbi:MAG: RES domain-containing protein [Planctomycetes bacterium]|nr:RES domain-containing protein [Planctomycetota bacterium]